MTAATRRASNRLSPTSRHTKAHTPAVQRDMKSVDLFSLALVLGWPGPASPPANGWITTPATKDSVVKDVLREGDILFQATGGRQGDAIALATHSRWTHVGMAFRENGRWMVVEAVGPVKTTPLQEWIDHGDGEYAVKRLARDTPDLDPAGRKRLMEATRRFMGRPYDLAFEWSDERIYCSELVWKVYAEAFGIRLCEPRPLRDHDLDSKLVQTLMKERYGDAPPLDEPMVAPSTLFDCPLLLTVQVFPRP